jgi:hypothetical protein
VILSSRTNVAGHLLFLNKIDLFLSQSGCSVLHAIFFGCQPARLGEVRW